MLVIAAVIAAAAALSAAQAAVASSNPSNVTVAQATQRVVDDTNGVRYQAGTTGLVRNSALDQVAANWARQQFQNGAMSHNPNYSTQIPPGWSHAGENVAHDYSYDRVVAAWTASSSHYANLVGDYTDVGVGFYQEGTEIYWSQVFAKYSTTQVPTGPSSSSPTATPTASPSPTPSNTFAPATTTPIRSGGSVEPAAPAGTAIPLSNASFEGSSTGWTAANGSLVGPNSQAKGGQYALAVTTGSVVQSVATTVTTGDSYTATVWVRVGTGSSVSGTLALGTVGGIGETGTVSFSSTTSNWMKVSIPLNVTRSGHTGLRITVTFSGSGRLDSTSLVRTTAGTSTTAATAAPTTASTPPARPTNAPSSAPAPSASPTQSPAPAPAATAPAGVIDLGILRIG